MRYHTETGKDTKPGRPARLPVVPRRFASLDAEELAHCAAVAEAVAPHERLARDLRFFGPFAQPGLGEGAFIVLGDPGDIPVFGSRRISQIEHRLSVLAGDGDLVLIGGQRNPDFEAYRERRLGLGHPRYLQVAPAGNGSRLPAQTRCLKDAGAFAPLGAFARAAGEVTLVPHLASGTVWALARKLAAETGARVKVAGPWPTISALANDKLAFSAIARALFGEDAALPEASAHGPAALAAKVHAVAKGSRKLVVKLPDSAGSGGNYPLFSDDVTGMSLKQLHRHLTERLSLAPGSPRFPMIVQVWKNGVLSSPSLQLWIPDPKDGPPVIEGVFVQRVTGPAGRFIGATEHDGNEAWVQALCHGGLMLGQVFQNLGYFGRCSFDAVLSSADRGEPVLHWMECNGRWGGVSVPMTLMNRLFPGQTPPRYVIAHLSDVELPRRSFPEGLDILRDLLWHPGGERGVLFLTPAGFERDGGLHFVSIAPTTAEADAQATTVIERLAGA